MKRIRLRSLAPWLLAPVAAALAAVIASAPGGRLIDNGTISDMPWLDLFVGNLTTYLWWALLAPLIVFIIRRVEQWSAAVATRAAVHVCVAAAFVLLYFALRATIAVPWDRFNLPLAWRGLRSILPEAIGAYVLIAAATLAAAAYARSAARERRAARLETQLAEARLQVLRAQLHPHFLFNALHAVSALIDWRPAEARQMLSRLSELLRMALELSEHPVVPLTREADWVERYLELQQVRYGDRLRTDLRIRGDAIAALVPPLILQPLVENALKHGIDPRVEGGAIALEALRDGDRLRLIVRDDGPGPGGERTAAPGLGIGLANARDRLSALYGDQFAVELRRGAAGGAEAVIELPFRETTGRGAGGAVAAEVAPAPSRGRAGARRTG